MSTRFQSLLAAGLVLALTAVSLRSTEMPPVLVLHAPAWSQGDAVREGASEFMTLMEIARLQRAAGKGGLVGVGDRRGLFGPGAEEALHRAVLSGLPVVKLAASGHVLPAPHGLFLDGQNLSEQEAWTVLARCVEKYGALPAVSDAADMRQLDQLRLHLKRYQDEFTLAAVTRLAVR